MRFYVCTDEMPEYIEAEDYADAIIKAREFLSVIDVDAMVNEE